MHPFDHALQLQSDAADPDLFHGQAPEGYWNAIGPFGGTTAATFTKAVLQHPACLGEPLSLTVNYAGPVCKGPYTLRARPVRTNRSTQHWVLEQTQVNAAGEVEVASTATAVTALRRPVWSGHDHPMPQVPGPQECAVIAGPANLAWFDKYCLHPVVGAIPLRWDDSESQGSLSQLWARDEPPRPLDYLSLTALADIFFPRVWLRRARYVPAGTISLTVYFHTSAAQLATLDSTYLLCQARGQAFAGGYFDQSGQLWSQSGALLVTTHQTVYYKE